MLSIAFYIHFGAKVDAIIWFISIIAFYAKTVHRILSKLRTVFNQ